MEVNWYEWLGYLASLIVLISLLMSSIIKLRWINLIGSAIFSLYGFLISAYPVGIMNLGIVFINIYYLFKIYGTKEYFKLLPIEENTSYLNQFFAYYKDEIEKYSEKEAFELAKYPVRFFILRNMIPAGLFLASKHDEITLEIELDFVVPEYRDFKIGHYIFNDCKDYFLSKGYSKFISFSKKEKHINYLVKLGFQEVNENNITYYVKAL